MITKLSQWLNHHLMKKITALDCGGEKYIKHGFAHGLQGYHCSTCKKTLNTLTGTPLARLRHKDNWLEYLGTLCNSQTIRAAAKQVEISIPTSFRWKHRFLNLISENRPEGTHWDRRGR